MKNISNAFLPIQNKLVNYALTIFSILGVIMYPFTIYRSNTIWNKENIILSLITITVLVITYFKNKISLNIKVILICILGGFVVINGLLGLGLLASAKIYACIIPIFTSFILTPKKSFFVLLLFILPISIFGFLYSTEYLTYNYDVNNYVIKPQVWIVDILVIFMASLSILLVGKYYNDTIRQNWAVIEIKNIDLINRENKFRNLFESSKDSIILLSKDKIIDCNESTLKLFKCNKDYLLKIDPSKLNPKFQPDGNPSKDKISKVFSELISGLSENVEWQHIRPNGELFYVSVSLSLVNIDNKNVIQIIERDITEKKELELELTSHRKNLESLVFKRTKELELSLEREKELGVLKTNFISMASHEFRTPLASIQAAADVILRYSNKLSKEDIEKRLYKIKNEVADMAAMLEDILIIGKADAQKLKFNPKNIDIVKSVKKIINQFQLTQLTPRKVDWVCSNDSILTNMDPKWLKNIVDNLFTNALKFSEPSSKVEIGIKQENNKVILSVSDQGIGIPKNDIKKLFEPFHRGENADQISGTGLGLAVVQKAVELHKGEIFVTSELNKGTAFKIFFTLNNNF